MVWGENKLVRKLQLSGKPSSVAAKDVTARRWGILTTKAIARSSAVGFVFSTELQKSLGCPVGLIQANWGGSPGKMWIERSIYDKVFPGGKKANPEWLKEFETSSREYHTKGEGEREYGDEKFAPGSLYTVYTQPMIGMTIRGIIWYCSGTLTLEMETVGISYRRAWGDDNLPFLYVQIPPSGGEPQTEPKEKGDPNFRTEYCEVARTGRLKNSLMVVTVDTVDKSGKKNIHPGNKRPVGERLTKAAQKLAYGKDIIASGPLPEKYDFSDGQVTVTFNNTGSGLIAKDGDLEGFAIAGEDGKWVWAKAVIDGNKVVLSSDQVKKPVAVRYAIHSRPLGNLYNKEGWPASPFASDVKYP